jgi:cell division protein FtsI (penicillin-binding protein 3)
MTAIFTKRQSGKTYYGAGLSGPVQKEIATYLYNRQYNGELADTEAFASEIKGGRIEKMRKVANKYGEKCTYDSRDGWGQCFNGSEGSLHIRELDMEGKRVPNVVGMGLDDALYLLEKSGLRVEVKSYGKVVKQSLAPNMAITSGGERITIILQ